MNVACLASHFYSAFGKTFTSCDLIYVRKCYALLCRWALVSLVPDALNGLNSIFLKIVPVVYQAILRVKSHMLRKKRHVGSFCY